MRVVLRTIYVLYVQCDECRDHVWSVPKGGVAQPPG
jgi:hypothetical protein